jgi:predicted small lipoprotein YifL
MTPRLRAALLAALLSAGAAGCGQQGPLVLPGDARPIQRIDPPPAEPEPADDEREREC